MSSESNAINRRGFITATAAGVLLFTSAGAFADELVKTPRQTEGPFYPDHLPLDTDNDLIVINDSLTDAVGDITYLSGRILSPSGEPVRNAVVEIWQVDNKGNYLHSKGANPEAAHPRDTNFQGFGRFVTGSSGEYLFRTIKPVPYPGRTPHIHVAVKQKGREKFVTQCYVKGESGNEKDGVLAGIKDPKEKASVIIPFAPLPGSKIGELAAKFNIVLPTA
jgi:protocatechuate 3,4-dioxygenase beta subunit